MIHANVEVSCELEAFADDINVNYFTGCAWQGCHQKEKRGYFCVTT